MTNTIQIHRHALPIVEFRSRRNLTTHLKRKMRTLVQRLEREGLGMSKVAHQSDPVMLNEQSFEQFGSDQVAYKIWCSIDTAFELLGQFDPL